VRIISVEAPKFARCHKGHLSRYGTARPCRKITLIISEILKRESDRDPPDTCGSHQAIKRPTRP
jgi:hypothetical protein